MAELTKRQKKAMKEHSVHHSAKHMNFMRKLIKEGSTFTQAHTKAIKKVGADMFTDTLMGKISAGDSPSGVANKYASVDFFDELSAANMGDALATGKAPSAVDPATNDRAMTALLTKMLSDPAYSKQIGV